MKSLSRVASVLAVSAVVGCAGGGAGGGGASGGRVVDAARFPDRATVAAIAARPVPVVAERGVSVVNSWTFTGPFAGTFTDVPVVEVTPLEQPYARAFGQQRFSEASRCVATELARVIATRGDAPDARFRAQLQARCGSTGQPGHLQWWTFKDVAKATDAQLQDKLTVDAQTAFTDVSGDLGVGIARVGDVAVAALVSTVVEARIVGSRVAGAGVVEVKGTLVDGGDAEAIWGYVNMGDTGVATCVRRDGALPSFVLSCPIDANDAVAGFELLVQRRGRLLGSGVASGLLATGTAPSTTWAATTWGAEGVVPDDADALAAAVLNRTNGIRAGAGLTPLLADAQQSSTTSKLTPQYFGNLNDGPLIDQIALGAMAGWDLKTPVRDGHFSSLNVGGSALHELMGAVLDSPSSRSTLLAVDVGPVAIGAMRSGATTGLLLTTWEPYIAQSATDVQRTVFDALKAERRRRGHTNGLGEVGMEDAVADASGELQNGADPSGVLNTLLRRTADQMHYSFTGWSVITTDPDHIAWPEELLTSRMTYVAVAAGTRLKAGNPWATTAVLIVGYVAAGMTADATTTTMTLPAK